VSIESREVRRSDIQSQAVTRPKAIRCRPHIDLDAIDPPRLEGLRLSIEVAIAKTQDPALQLNRPAVGKHITESCRHIRVARAGAKIQDQAKRTDYVYILFERFGGKAHHVRSPLDLAHVDAAGGIDVGDDAPTSRGSRILRIVCIAGVR